MPIRVQVGGKVVEFPDGTTEDVMRKALSGLQADPAPTTYDMLTRTGPASSSVDEEHEPDTWRGGFIRGLRREFVDPLLSSETAQHAAHPTSAADVGSLLIPSAIGMGSANEFIPAAKKLYQGAAQGAADKEGLKKIPAVIKGMWGATKRNPEQVIANYERDLYSKGHVAPDTASVIDKGVPQGEMPQSTLSMVDKNYPNRSGYRNAATDTSMRTSGELPQSTASMVETPQEALARKTFPMSGGVQTERTPYGGVEVPYRVKKPRMGKMVDNPYGKDTPLDEVLQGDLEKGGEAAVAPEGVQRSPSDTRSTGKADKMADTASGTDSLEELLNALHGEDSPLAINAEGHGTAKPFFNAKEVSGIQGKTGQMLPSQDLAEEAASLRRMKGSRDAGSAMFPDLAPAERGGLVKKLAPGPSQVPLEAEARINSAAQKAKGDIPSLLLAMLTGGGGALAARQTVPDSTLGLPE